MASNTLATVFAGLFVAIGALELVSFLDQSDAMSLAQVPPLDAVVKAMAPLAAIGAFDAAVALIFVHLHNGGGAGNGWIREVATFISCASTTGVLELLHPAGAMDDGVGQALAFDAAVRVLLPGAATATLFLSITLIYVHVHMTHTVHGAGAGAGNGQILAGVKLLITKMVLAAAALTVFLSLIAAIVAF